MDFTNTFKSLYPEGTRGGECGTFCHNLVDFPPVGNSYKEKKKAVGDYGIRSEFLHGNFAVGDTLISSEGTFLGFGTGHVATVNFINKDFLFLTESNFHKDGRVHHTRSLSKTDPKIYGVIRGSFKFPVIYDYPIQIPVTVLFNNQKAWNSAVSRFAQLQDWFYTYSQKRIQLVIDYKEVNVSGWDYRIDYSTNLDIMNPAFYNSKILPLSSTPITLFVASNADWKKPNNLTQETKGYCWTENGRIKSYIVCDETEMSQNYFGLPGFVDYSRHEIAHGLYALSAPSDLCHNRYYGLNGYPKDFESVFLDFDVKLLNRSV